MTPENLQVLQQRITDEQSETKSSTISTIFLQKEYLRKSSEYISTIIFHVENAITLQKIKIVMTNILFTFTIQQL